jgi:hypothetical protein
LFNLASGKNKFCRQQRYQYAWLWTQAIPQRKNLIIRDFFAARMR